MIFCCASRRLGDPSTTLRTVSAVSATSLIISDGSTIRFGWASNTSLKKSPPLWVDSWVCQIIRVTSRIPTGFTLYWL